MCVCVCVYEREGKFKKPLYFSSFPFLSFSSLKGNSNTIPISYHFFINNNVILIRPMNWRLYDSVFQYKQTLANEFLSILVENAS